MTMGRTLNEVMAGLPKARRRAIEKREAEMSRWEEVYEFAGWLSETGEDLHELPNVAVIAIVDRFFKEREQWKP